MFQTQTQHNILQCLGLCQWVMLLHIMDMGIRLLSLPSKFTLELHQDLISYWILLIVFFIQFVGSWYLWTYAVPPATGAESTCF